MEVSNFKMRTNSRCARTLSFKTDKCNFTVGDDTLSVNKFFERMVILSVLALFWSVLLPFATPC